MVVEVTPGPVDIAEDDDKIDEDAVVATVEDIVDEPVPNLYSSRRELPPQYSSLLPGQRKSLL